MNAAVESKFDALLGQTVALLQTDEVRGGQMSPDEAGLLSASLDKSIVKIERPESPDLLKYDCSQGKYVV